MLPPHLFFEIYLLLLDCTSQNVVRDLFSGCMNVSDVFNGWGHDTRQLHLSCTICRRTANLPGLAWQNERRKEMFYLTTLSTHFYLRLYGVRHMVKDHSGSEKGNPLPPPRILFPISSKGSFICTIPDRIAHTTAFVTPVVEHWLEREIWQNEACSRPHHSNHLAIWNNILVETMYKIIIGYTNLGSSYL